jgi:hypothetical protein
MGFEGDLYGKIVNCPISMVAAKDKQKLDMIVQG